MKRWLREPLLHFLLIGTALFAIYGYQHRGTDGAEPSRQIALTPDDLRQLAAYFESEQHRPPTPEELNKLVENKVQVEVLYREALALGLDKDDVIVRGRLAEKMQFLAQDVSAADEPTSAELKAWFERNINQFVQPSRVSFRHLYFSANRRGRDAQGDAAKALAKISGETKDSKLTASLADPFMFQDYYSGWSPEELSKDFGSQFGPAVAKLQPGSWQGPIESEHGWHLIFVDSATPGRTPAFEEIEPDIKTAWLDVQKEQAWRKAYDAMRGKYSVRLSAAPTKETTETPAPHKPRETPISSDGEPL